MIAKIVANNKSGDKTCLLKDKESYTVATSEIYGLHRLPRDTTAYQINFQQVLHDVGKQSISNGIQSKSAQRYARIVIQRVSREQEESEGQKFKKEKFMINVSGLSHNKSKKIDPRLA